MSRAFAEDFRWIPTIPGDVEVARVPDLEELIAGLRAREAAWNRELGELQTHSEQQAAVFAKREAAAASREAALLSRLEQRGRVIDELTMFLSEMTSLRQEEAQALEETENALKIAKTRLAKTRRAAKLVTAGRLKKARKTRESDSVPVD